jgi:hypothetical protein
LQADLEAERSKGFWRRLFGGQLMSFVDMLTLFGSLGIVGAASTYVLNTITRHGQNRREKVGLTRLLYHELEGNRSVLYTQVYQLSDKILAEKLRSEKYDLHLATDGWEAARVRLAQLLSEDEFAVLCNYYISLRVLKDYIQGQLHESDKIDLNEALKGAKDTHDKATATGNKYWETRCMLKRYIDIDSAAEALRPDPSVTGAEN